MWIKSTGRIISGKSLGVFDRDRPFWLVLNCSKDIMFFYLNQIKNEEHQVSTPLAGSHISVVRKERPRRDAWEASHGLSFSFEYQPMVHTNGRHWWLPVRSNALLDLRESFGLNRIPHSPLHLTVACSANVQDPMRKQATKEVHLRLKTLLNMKRAIPYKLWENSPEQQEFETLMERFIL